MIDLLAHGLRCGEYGDLPPAIAKAHAKAGHFDLKAVSPEDPAAQTAREKKPADANGDDGEAGTAALADSQGVADANETGGEAGGADGGNDGADGAPAAGNEAA